MSGKLEIAQWIYDNCRPQGSEITLSVALDIVLDKGILDIVKWLHHDLKVRCRNKVNVRYCHSYSGNNAKVQRWIDRNYDDL
jgi:hypothetical protein